MTALDLGGPTLAELIPAELRSRVGAWYGDPGREWLSALPSVVDDLVARWRLRLREILPAGGNALVLAGTRGGDDVLLKLPMRDEENRHEPHALRVYDGDGAVLLYGYDEPSGAMLVERAEPGTPLDAHPDGPAAASDVLCGLLRRLRRPVPPGLELPSVGGWAQRFAAELPGLAAGLPESSAPLVAEAAALARRYAARPDGPELMVNRDAHGGSVLAAGREPWLLIHPRPVLGEPAYEAAQPLLRLLGRPAGPAVTPDGAPADPPEAVAGPGRVVALAALLGRGLGVDPQRVRGWALVRAVGNATWAASLGHDPGPDLAQAAALHAAG